ncbi:alpha/beta hydrolase [Nitrococcus mobilis]|uniref:AB hydrolase-1 domain-containing protein n=1 Tax=Nitrococcus mobilis Nb-231 TaxID=314278 RepID=A4BPK4_9GAMM|nr:alpha/beta hydrolase [Nitrococcus mobilis]EAR22505.1 hypothetical protein NB231_12234 [Nitrococcus mobilis Nb-231]
MLVTGCATPGARLSETAEAHGFSLAAIDTGRYKLIVYLALRHDADEQPLHVYFSGDGTPWMQGRYPAADPSPRHALALRLMALDPAPSLQLNRPCYGHETMPEVCDPALWTYGRYSDQVVEAMSRGLDTARTRLGANKLVLIGYSGGGTLARLVAQRRDDVLALVTIAANLDHRRWTAHHQYLPLTRSLDPTTLLPLPSTILQWHLVGGHDHIVPAAVTRAGIRRESAAEIRVFTEFNHRCCWEQIWPQILAELRLALIRVGR